MKINISDIKLLLKILKMSDTQLHDYLYGKLVTLYGKEKIVRKVGKYLVAVGSKIGLVAHLDVVGDIPPKEIVYNKKYITAINSILGADDRVGVFIILKMLQLGFRPTVIFTHDEEKGTIGARELAQDFCDLGVNYLVQLDRRGKGVVFYDNDNREFIDYILSFRDKEEFGSFSDISVICPMCNVSGCNLGVGYYNEHMSSEYQSIEEMEDTIRVVYEMLVDEPNSKYYEYQQYQFNNSNDYATNETLVSYNGQLVPLSKYYEIIYGEEELDVFIEEEYLY